MTLCDYTTIQLVTDNLRDHGDTVTLPDGKIVRLHIDYDPWTTINDFDCYGKVSDRSYPYHGDLVFTPRPQGFTGAARKLQVDRDQWVWWEPYREGHKVHDTPADVALVRRLLHEGFLEVGLTLHEHLTDSRGNTHLVEIDRRWTGGVDSLDNGHLADVVSELARDLLS
jgi:hypothetical protein